ncbi:MAG: hypothetical protein KDC80_01650, partial [Saprospiraceae bacterium]|nr:hypothetical protein [Saprospiraceae bacterium]
SIHPNEINIASTDNCGALTLSFSDTDMVEVVELNCADIGSKIQRLWGKDGTGNLNYCDVLLTIQSNTGACPD